MATARAALTDYDIRVLVKGETDRARAVAARRVCRALDDMALTEVDREQAQEVLRLMARDAADLVRAALARTLRASPLVPRDLALQLARDIDSVCVPILSESPVFTDADLIEIVLAGDATRQAAIAGRRSVSQAVSLALVEHGVQAAAEIVCANDNADVGDRALRIVIERFPQSVSVLAAVAHRKNLSPVVTEKLVALTGGALRDRLVDEHAVPPELALRIVTGATERATMDLVEAAGRAADIKAFVAHLRRHGRLTASLLLRGLAQGHMAFVEWGLAELAAVPHDRTWVMVHDCGPLGLKTIYERAGLPPRLYGVFQAGVEAYRASNFDGGPGDRERFQERMLQRFLTQPAITESADVDYLLDKMDALSAFRREAVSVDAR